MSQEKSPKPADEIVSNNVRNDETANQVERVQVQGIRLIHLLQKSARIGGLLLVVWLVGCLGFSVTWVVVGSLAYGALSEYWRNKKAQCVVVTAVDVDNLARIDELPQWVYFPDSERAEWLNKVILKMWPNIGVYINNLLKKQIELLVNSALPSSLTPFKFEEVHLGNVPPRIGGVKTYVDNVRRDEIILDAEIMYAGDTSLTVSLRGFRAGVKDITVNGVVRIIFRPLVNKIPIIGGLSVFFLKPPNIDFDLTNLTNALELPLISLTLRTIVNDQLANYVVLPHKIPVQLLDLQDLESILFNTPRGVVRLTAVRAADLIVADKKLIGKGSSDPYCRITVGSQTVETKVVEKCLDPTWNETFEFIVTTEEVLLVEVFDKDQTGTDDFLGRIRINLTELASSSSVDKWFDLTDVKSGKIYLSIKWFQLVKDSSALEKAKQQNELDERLSSAVLMVIIDSIKNLPAVKKFKKMMTQRAGAEPSPFVSIKVGNIKQLTEVRQNSTNPKWDKFQFNFLVNGSVTQDLSVEVIDDNNKNGQALGSRKVPLRDVLSSNEMTVCRPYGLRNSGPDTTIVLRLAMRILSLETPTSVCEEKTLSTAVSDASNAGPVIEAGGCKSTETAGQQTGLVKATESTSPAVVTQKTPDVNENKDVRATAVAVATTAAAAGSSPLNSSNVGGAGQSVAGSDGSQLRQRRSNSRFGHIQLTIQCSSRTKLAVTVHQCSNLIPCDADNLADPYVKLFLLPDRSSAGKRKTNVVKNNLNPTFNATVEWSVDIANLGKHTLEVFVKNEVGLFAKGRVNMGVLHVDLSKIDVATKPVTDWYDLQDPDSAQFKD